MEMRRGRSIRVFSLNLGLGDPQPAVSRCSEQQGNTFTISRALQVRASLCLSEGLELGNRPCPTQGVAALGLCSLPGDKASQGVQGGILFHRQNSPVKLAALRYQNCGAKEVSKEKLKRLKGVWTRKMSLPARGPLEKAVCRMPPAQGTSRNASISAARGFPRTSRMCHALHVSPVPQAPQEEAPAKE